MQHMKPLSVWLYTSPYLFMVRSTVPSATQPGCQNPCCPVSTPSDRKYKVQGGDLIGLALPAEQE